MNDRILITDAKLVNEGKIIQGSVLVEDGKISEIFPKGREGELFLELENIVLIDGRNKFLLPGVIDDHVHFRDPGLTEKGDLYTESKAAVAGGVTSFMDMPNTIPAATTLAVLEEKFRMAASKSLANFSFFLGASNNNISEIEKADPSKICGLKLFLGSSTGNMLVDDPEMLRTIFSKSKVLIAAHCEDEMIIRGNLASAIEKFGEAIPAAMHPMIRSEEACYRSTQAVITLAKKYDARLHVLHLSTARELDLFDENIPLPEKKITAEVCIHHLLFDDSDYENLGTKIKINPAVKTADDRKSLLAGLIGNKIDLVATDHAPHAAADKKKPYKECPSGAPMIQHSLIAMLELVHQGKITIEKVVEKMCHAPATVYRIRKRGFLRKGYYADLVLVDPDSLWTVEPSNILYKCRWSSLEGRKFSSEVTHTFVNGNLVYHYGIFDERVKGKRLEFGEIYRVKAGGKSEK
jgi:dihydroorotase